MTREPANVWTPLYRADLETLLHKQEYTTLHVTILSWLIWLSLLSEEELLRVLSQKEQPMERSRLSDHLSRMARLGLIDAIMLREPTAGRQKRYYATDMGLYLYLSAIHPSPPLTMARLAQSYPVERADLLARLARPHIHLACTSLATRIIAEGATYGNQLISYQQTWQHVYSLAQEKHTLASDAALLIERLDEGTFYAFLVYVDIEPHQKAERAVEHWLLSLLDLRQRLRLYRHQWPEVFIISTRTRPSLWAQLLLKTSIQRTTTPLAGGITTLDALSDGIYTPIWWDLAVLASGAHSDQYALSHFLREPASKDLVEHLSNQHHFYAMRLKETASPPPRTKKRLHRYVGDALQDEAAHLTKERLIESFSTKRKNQLGIEGAGLLTLTLTGTEKALIGWAAHHPLLDVPTFQALLRPGANPRAIKPLQQHITHLFQLGLIEVRLWSAGRTPLEQQRYLLTPVALKFMAVRIGEPYTYYFVSPKYQKNDDEQLDRQWGTRGLNGQMWHTNALYSFMRQLYRNTYARGEIIYHWKSAHESARWYRDSITQNDEHTRPDAEILFALSPTDDPVRMVLLEYDRGTTGIVQYTRKFTAYLDYHQATGVALPLLVVTTSHKAIARMQQVLDTLGTLRIIMLLEKDLLAQGFTLVVRHFSP
ncbi:replication-relaxation family protein [Dictyobacter formicarum]|uniref:Helicase XPB/Ssl2 N-terminal domain-containing protein n=1 Tax=Dictyobacter formicarum TaxID=2778368 RepID=A0ABQ3V861_9CHLR|nr:replication-relaxation family protein [Dictyobacter formicarum]GHO82322.1 hypothetical protein KSZ_03280 [Dictyobacter formicarum]